MFRFVSPFGRFFVSLHPSAHADGIRYLVINLDYQQIFYLDKDMTRISANSQSLKEKFPQVYKDFFSQCHTIISVPCHFSWAGDISGYYGGFQIIQKLPIRVYVGLSESKSEKELTIENQCRSFFPNLQNFQEQRIDNIAKPISRTINELEYQRLFKKPCHIRLLSEHPIPSGIIGFSPLAAAVFFCLSLNNQLISIAQFSQWPKTTIAELKNNPQYRFSDLFLGAWHFVEAVRDAPSTGVTTLNAFLGSNYPIIFFSENKNWHGWRLNEIFPLPKDSCWPIDFGLIYSGDICKPISVIIGDQNQDDSVYSTIENIRKMALNIPQLSTPIKSTIKSKKSFWSIYTRIFDAIALTVLYGLINLLSQNINQEKFRLFFAGINQHYDLFQSLGLSNNVIEEIINTIRQSARKNNIEVAATSTGLNIGSELLFALPSHSSFKEDINNIILSLKRNYSSDVALDYASWLDGYETEGIKIEQSLEFGIYSEFISKDTIQVKAINRLAERQFLISPEEYEKEKAKVDLIINEKNDEIFIGGREMRSQELHSKKFTIKILKLLLADLSREITNSQLPDSSYQSNRYDFQGKIIDPLKRALIKWASKDLDLRISGGIANFSIKFSPGDLTIWFIEKR